MLKRMRELVRRRRYAMTTHPEGEADADGLTVLDIESVFLAGEIVDRQKDRGTGEWKYVVRGSALDEREACVVAKIGPLGNLYILIVYEG